MFGTGIEVYVTTLTVELVIWGSLSLCSWAMTTHIWLRLNDLFLCFDFFFLEIFVCTYVYVMHVFAKCVKVSSQDRRGRWIPQRGIYRHL